MLENIKKLNTNIKHMDAVIEKKTVKLNEKMKNKKTEILAETRPVIQAYYNYLMPSVQKSFPEENSEMKEVNKTNKIKNKFTHIKAHGNIKDNEKENATNINNLPLNLNFNKEIKTVIKLDENRGLLNQNKTTQSTGTWLNISIDNNKTEDVNMYVFTSWGNGNQVDIKRNDYGKFILIPSNEMVESRIKEQSRESILINDRYNDKRRENEREGKRQQQTEGEQ
ncbi:type III secretion system needle length determinant, SpaN/EivJ family [Escherichia coli]|uniref:SpaN/EivJ family type III secretion system needle length determinant n=1 Tax=Escherichia coli TaxID=562 RepID=UPI002FF2AC17